MSNHLPRPAGPITAVSDEDLARAWHRLSDHGQAGAAFDEPGCVCRHVAPRVRQLLDWFIDTPAMEPAGLGAVVANPITGRVWVRAAHPHVPWKGTEDGPQEWADPTAEQWSTWEDLPRPLQLKAAGWEPPTEGARDPAVQGARTGS